MRWMAAAACAMIGLMGCGGQEEPLGVTGSAATVLQGMQLQGMQLQGMQLQGMQLQGMQLQGMQLQGTTLTGALDDQLLRGPTLVGATVTGFTSDGAAVLMTIADVEPDPTDESGEVWLYTLRYQVPETGLWENPCGADLSGRRAAIPVSGVWDASGAWHDAPDRFTFGCTSGVIAKCVRWGYRPWQTFGSASLRDYHQACTRMARADYCGDGTSYTRDGTRIDVYDRLGIQQRDQEPGLVFEAAWTPDGAACISKARWPEVAIGIRSHCPHLLQPALLSGVTNHQQRCAMYLRRATAPLMRNDS